MTTHSFFKTWRPDGVTQTSVVIGGTKVQLANQLGFAGLQVVAINHSPLRHPARDNHLQDGEVSVLFTVHLADDDARYRGDPNINTLDALDEVGDEDNWDY